MTRPLRLGLMQMNSGIDPLANAEALESGIAALAAERAQIVFTPEMSGCLDKSRERLMQSVRTEANDPVLARVRAAAERHGVWVQLGSLALRAVGSDEDKLVNRGFLIAPDGSIAARYDKIHLFDVDLGGGERYGESKVYQPGTKPVLAEAAGAALGLSICYDIRFPRLYDVLSAGGAEIIAIPAAFTVPTGKAHWHLLQRARAVESQCFTVAAAQVGEHEDGRATYGHSLVVDPWGEVLLDMGGDAPGTATCEIDLSRIAEVRRGLPSHAHRTHIPPL
ncbi:MAG: carbon-nitrogen hydrolase family protein [Pacificimonas sp.]|jgi:predicted amidohydrolase|nr:carbon-nitrogen hydrolase family protein [Pacificimonas sp.]